MIGQDAHEQAFIDAMLSGRMPHAWLLAGPRGVGKAGFALRAATFLLTGGHASAESARRAFTVDAADPVARMIANGAHPDFLLLEREVPEAKRPKDGGPGKPEDVARSITVAQVRNLLARLRVKPAGDGMRCVIIDSIDDMERSAANALLKTLEEPPERTLFLLVSHNPGRLLPTIRSRCRLLRFGALRDDQVREILTEFHGPMDDAAMTSLLALAAGSPGRALQCAQDGAHAYDAPLMEILRTGDRDNHLRSELARAISGSGSAQRIAALIVQANAIATNAARSGTGEGRARAIDARQHIAEIESRAISGSEDPASVAFAIGTALSDIAAPRP